MFDITNLDNILEETNLEGSKFEPRLVNCGETKFMSEPKNIPSEDNNFVDVTKEQLKFNPISPIILDKKVIAIDSTSMPLGIVENGLIGVVRVSQIIKPAGERKHLLERYGPKEIFIKNQSRDEFYKKFFHYVCGEYPPRTFGSDSVKVLDGIRNLYEKYIQFKAIKNYQDSYILLDGSLLGGTVTDTAKYIREMVSNAQNNVNQLVAISKFTNLILRSNGKSILSLLEHENAPGFVGPINQFIDVARSSQYLGNIYVVKLTSYGKPFRIDIPKNSIEEPDKIFNKISSISGDYGYPEELKIAHTTCVHSAIEILALQAHAIGKYKMQIEENLRRMIFAPFTR